MNARHPVATVLFCCLMALMGARSLADTIVYQHGASNAFVSSYAGTDDTFVLSDTPTFNFGGGYGADQTAYIGGSGRKALVRFDLSSFSGGYSSISGISLSLDFKLVLGIGTISIYAVSAANAGWVEGTGTGTGSAINGTSSWNSRLHSTTPWAGSAGLSTAGTDYDSLLLASAPTAINRVTFNFTGTPAQLKALVDLWSGPQAQNAGLLIVSDAGTQEFRTSEKFSTGLNILPPTLTITYQPPMTYAIWSAAISWGLADSSAMADPDGDDIKNLAEFALGLNPLQSSSHALPQGSIQGSNLVIGFTQPAATTGITYAAEWSTTLAPGDWLPATDGGSGLQHSFSVPVGANTRLFMRFVFTQP